MDISAIQIVIVLVIALLVFGPSRLPDLARQVGKAIREVKGQVSAMSDDVRGALDVDGADHPADRAREVVRDESADVPAAPVTDELDDDLLDGIVVPGDTPPPTARDAQQR